jgi:hypothetical protein
VAAVEERARPDRRVVNVAHKKRQFLRALAAGHTVVGAAAKAGRTARTVERWREADPKFADDWAHAEQVRREAVAETVWDRAQRSDNLLMFYAKRLDPSFRDNPRVEITGANGGPVQHEHKVVSATAVYHVLAEAGAIPGPGEVVPGPGEILAAQSGEESEAGSVPAPAAA